MQRAGASRRTDQNVDGTAEDNPGAIYGQGQLLRVRNIGPNPERVSSCLLDFDMGKIHLRLTAADEGNFGSEPGEAQSKSLSDAASGSGDHDGFVLELGFLSQRTISKQG